MPNNMNMVVSSGNGFFPDETHTCIWGNMKKRRKGRTLLLLAIVLVIALTAVIGVIAYKEQEYKAGTDYYSSLRAGDTE